MFLSVIIPAYNCSQTLFKAVESIQNSGISNYEIIIVDDGSTDGTGVLCDELASQHREIRCVHQYNAGVSQARNRGFREAAGKYILFFDADDTVESGAFSEIESMLLLNTPDLLVYGVKFDYYYHGKCYRSDDLICKYEGLYQRGEWLPLLEELFDCNYLSPVWNKIILRDVIQMNGIHFSPEMHLMEDCLFTLQCLDCCETIYLLPRALYHYRQADDEGNAARRMQSISSLTAYMSHFASLPKRYDEIVRRIYFMLLRQSVGSAWSEKKLQEIAEDDSVNSIEAVHPDDKKLRMQLRNGEFKQLIRTNQKTSFRHKVAVLMKRYLLIL